MLIMLIVGLGFVVAGCLAYTGRWRSWTSRYIFRPYLNFGLLWMGLACWALAPAIGLDRSGHELAGLLPGLLGIGCWAVFLLSLVWLPSWLTPAWFRGWKDGGMRRAEFARAPATSRSERRRRA